MALHTKKEKLAGLFNVRIIRSVIMFLSLCCFSVIVSAVGKLQTINENDVRTKTHMIVHRLNYRLQSDIHTTQSAFVVKTCKFISLHISSSLPRLHTDLKRPVMSLNICGISQVSQCKRICN